ncbi:OmpA family protein [Candidatus Kapabacteria bacterium]|nr:OmpA family protein [Candidatus Kapabacteria bacterium]
MIKYIINTFLVLFAFSCASIPEMETIDFKGFTTIKKGDSARINWDFKNAYYVEIDGIPQKFAAKDTIFESPESSKVYNFMAIQDEDTIRKSWRVIVMIPEEEKKLKEFQYETSYTESKYLKGVMDNAKIIAPNRLKITKLILDSNDNSILFNGLILDEFGNYISGLTGDNKITWHIKQECNNNKSKIELDDYTEVLDNNINSNFYYLIDKSAAAEYLSSVKDAINVFSKNINLNDRVTVSAFDHKFEKLIENSNSKNFDSFDISLKKTTGLSALYKNTFKALSEHKDNNGNNVLIVINFSANNAATIYNISDVIKEARKSDIPIYIISIGDAIDSFSAKYLSYGSGGSYYNLSIDNIHLLNDVLKEIQFAQKAHYKFKIPYQNLNDCSFDATTITGEFNDKMISDNVYLIKTPEWLGSKSQSIALFDYKDSQFNPDFSNLINSMSRVLNDNPDFSLELIGHSSIEGSEDTNQEISYKRAKSINDEFLKLGVEQDQIKIRAQGSSMPVFFLPNSAWQQYYNRRVEVRWLIPEMLPYEIVAQEFWTEDEAMKNVNDWRDRGFQSYFERYLVENMPRYKVKLWGYKSEEAAKEDISVIGAKFNIKARIE